MTSPLFCDTPDCPRPREADIYVTSIMGTTQVGGACGRHIMSQLDARAKDRKLSRDFVYPAHIGCERCEGMGFDEGSTCQACIDWLDQAAAPRFGDLVHYTATSPAHITAFVITWPESMDDWAYLHRSGTQHTGEYEARMWSRCDPTCPHYPAPE